MKTDCRYGILMRMGFLLVLAVGSLGLAAVTESQDGISVAVGPSDEAKSLYFRLKLPEAVGTDPSGKKALMKRYIDATGTLSFYCAVYSGGRYTCGAEIKKVSKSEQIEVEQKGMTIRAVLRDLQEVHALFDAIDAEPVQHGGYFLKFWGTEDLSLGFSCLRGHMSSDNDLCQLLIQ